MAHCSIAENLGESVFHASSNHQEEVHNPNHPEQHCYIGTDIYMYDGEL